MSQISVIIDYPNQLFPDFESILCYTSVKIHKGSTKIQKIHTEDLIMLLLNLYTFMLPLITFLGTICLIALAAASVLFVVVWIVKKIWKPMLITSAIVVCLLITVIIFGAML